MDNFLVLLFVGLLIGTTGTLIGAGGGFLLVPLLLLTHPELPPELITAISLAIVAANAVSGTIAYARSGRIDYKAGLIFAAFTIPGSVLGVFLTSYIPRKTFDFIFGVLLLLLSSYLFIKNRRKKREATATLDQGNEKYKLHSLTDREGHHFTYRYNQLLGIIISIIVGFISPILGIGGGIIHVPAMVQWLRFPVYIATVTSHFILAIMATVSVGVHLANGAYARPDVQHLLLWLAIGVIPGAQLGAYLSHKVSTITIIKSLAVCLALVGIRVLLNGIG